VQVVDHQLEWPVEPLELGQESLDHRRPCEAGGGADPLDDVIVRRVSEGVDQVKPEALRVTFAALDRDPGDGLDRLRGPRAQENGLAASGRCADESHRSRSGG
jgi:hypothetical protein